MSRRKDQRQTDEPAGPSRGDGYGQFFKQARRASGLSSDHGSEDEAPRGTRRQFSVQPELGDDLGVTAHFSSLARGGAKPSKSKTSTPIKRSPTPEQNLRRELGARMEQRKTAARRKKAAFPKGATAFLAIIVIGAGFGYYRPEIFESIAAHFDIGVFGQANAAEIETKDAAAAKKSGKKTESGKTDAKENAKDAAPTDAAKTAAGDAPSGEKSADGESGKKDEKALNVHGWTPEELSFFNKLNDRKKELDLREAELNKLEEELQKQKAQLDEKLKQLDQTRTEISSTLKTRVTTDQAKIDKLVDFYSTMKPQQASKVIESLNEDLAVTVLDKMKKKNAAEILNMMDSKKARRLSELLTGYERTPAADAATVDEAANGTAPATK